MELCSGPIAVDMKLLSPGQMLALQQPFQVEGEVASTAVSSTVLCWLNPGVGLGIGWLSS